MRLSHAYCVLSSDEAQQDSDDVASKRTERIKEPDADERFSQDH